MAIWKIFYGDGSTFSNEDGIPACAPALNVQAIAQNSDITIGRRVTSRYDFYWFDKGEWYGGDLFGLFDFLQRASVVKFGRAIPRLEFETILNDAVTDQSLLPKTAWDANGA